MDEVWFRGALVVGALLIAGLVVLLRRWTTRPPVRHIESVNLDQGIYFFSSATCPTCSRARSKLDSELGEGGYAEFAWEEAGSVFAELNIDAVPAVLVVGESGNGQLYPGQPGRVLRSV